MSDDLTVEGGLSVTEGETVLQDGPTGFNALQLRRVADLNGSGLTQRFTMQNSASEDIDYATITPIIADRTDGNESGYIAFSTMKDGVQTNALKVGHETIEVLAGHNLRVDGVLNQGTFSATGATNGVQLNAGQIVTSRSISTSATHAVYFNPNGQVGSVSTSGTATSFNISSDPRLKSEFAPITNASEMILEARDQGMIGEFHFLSEPTQTIWGYNAHKLIDAQPNFGGSEGEGSRDAPLGDDVTPAGVDQSKRVPILEAAIGELLDRIRVLENA